MKARAAARRGAGATIREVAQQAGVSLMTVSRVVNDSPSVSPATRARVREVIAQLGFVPNRAARSLRSRRSLWIALVFQRAVADGPGDVSYVIELQEGVIRRCRENGYHAAVELLDAGSRAAGQQLRELARQLAPDGILLAPPLSSAEPLVGQLRALHVPFVRIAPRRAAANESCVMMDDRAAARQMTEYLLSLGHRRIGFVQGHPGHAASAQRLAGYRAALREWRVPAADERVVPGDFTFEGGRRGAARLLDAAAAPSAIFASNDESAAGCLAEAHARQLQVPGDLSITGFDDTYVATMLYPPLTTIRQSIREMGYAATGQLLGLIEGAAPVAALRIAHQLVERQSAGPPRAAAPRKGGKPGL
jgi:LacI family transcriptional regulator